MRPTSWRWLLLPALVVVAAGCETDRQGVLVDISAAVRAYQDQLDRKPGRAEMERMIARLPAQQLNDLGVLYEREGRLEDAIWAYQHAVWRDLRLAAAYVNFGNVLRKQGKPEQARFRYRQAMAADPRSFEAVNNFADLCAADGQCLDEAIERLESVLDEAGQYRPYGMDTLGWLYHLRGDNEKAREMLHAALREADTSDLSLAATINEHLAKTLRAVGQTTEAEGRTTEAEQGQSDSSERAS